jgi:predicted transposase YdaD
VLKSELSIEPIRADAVTFLQLQGTILHLEFQVKLDSEPPLSLRLLDYWVRLYRLYRVPIQQVVILLSPPPAGVEFETAFVLGSTRHEYRVVPLWEQDPALFLADEALLPLAALAATPVPEQLLTRVAGQVSRIESETRRREVSAYVQLLAGLRFEKDLIRQVFREGIVRESVIYQEILQEGRQAGLDEGLQHERSLIVRQLTRRLGEIAPEMEARIRALGLSQLEELGEALLDFEQLSDLENWLRSPLD